MQFQLYDLSKDPGEVHDLAKRHPDRFQHMEKVWQRYIEQNDIIRTWSK